MKTVVQGCDAAVCGGRVTAAAASRCYYGFPSNVRMLPLGSLKWARTPPQSCLVGGSVNSTPLARAILRKLHRYRPPRTKDRKTGPPTRAPRRQHRPARFPGSRSSRDRSRPQCLRIAMRSSASTRHLRRPGPRPGHRRPCVRPQTHSDTLPFRVRSRRR